MLYRKKPVIIEAERFDGTVKSATKIINWALQNGGTIRYHKETGDYWAYLSINTLEGTMEGKDGDYIIKGVQNEFYPCKPDIFEATYEKA
jgi:hypothetical protein